ncbi:MAG: rhodanese-like domain-containing protein [Thermodesulfobacteriota bacterium]
MTSQPTRLSTARSCAALLLLLCALPLATPAQGQPPAWWPDAAAQAARDGYTLLDDAGLDRVLDSGGALLLDVRPGYEFAAGHLPGAENLEFDLADQAGPSPDKRVALLAMVGPDLSRPVVIYCRSFR